MSGETRVPRDHVDLIKNIRSTGKNVTRRL